MLRSYDGQMDVVGIIFSASGCRLSYRATVDGRAKPEAYTQKGLSYTAYDEAGKPVYRGFLKDPRILELEGDGKIHRQELAEGDAMIRVPSATVRIVFRRWNRPVPTATGPPMPPFQEVVGELDL